jgi:hypothetical protein
MMKGSRSILTGVLLAGLLLVSLAACGGGSESTPAPQAAPTQAAQPQATQVTEAQPTQAPAPTQAPEPTMAAADTPTSEAATGTELDTSTLSTTSNLNSYRSQMTITAKGTKDGQEVQESLDFTIEYTKDPLVQHIVMSGTGFDSGGPGSIEMYQTADTTYMNMGGQWMSVPSTEANQIGESIITPQDMLNDTCGWTKEKDTEINGVNVEHYTTTKTQLEKCSGVGLLTGVGELSDAGGDLYVAKEGSYVAQMDFFYEGTGLDLNLGGSDESVQQGRMDIHFVMSDVNQPFTIQIPEEATPAGALPDDIPVPPDAEEVSNMFGTISFKSASTPQDVADFYKAEMPNNGWTQTSDETYGDTVMLEYTKDARTASFMISTDSDTGKTSVLITVQEGQ